uniref:C2H2-type domain-containing protein n=1 Tax=Glossina pallidipes TaxID=7398 RepID=A0A1A9ZRF3_GLOPL
MDIEYNEKVKHLRTNFQLCRNAKTTAQMVPKTWTKYGEIYRNDQSKCIFVCYICMEYAEHFANTYTTNSAFDFWTHLQHKHMLINCEMPDMIMRTKPRELGPHLETSPNGINEKQEENSSPRTEEISKCLENSSMVKENTCSDANNKGESLKSNFDDLKVGITINVSSDDNSSDLELLAAQTNVNKLFADEDDNISTKPNSPALNTSADDLGKLSTKPNSPILNTCADELGKLSTKPNSPILNTCADELGKLSTKPNSPILNTCADELGKLSTKPNSPILNTCADELDQLSTKPISPTLNRCAEETLNHHESQDFRQFFQQACANSVAPPLENNLHCDSVTHPRAYECNYCPQKFPQVWQLDRHQRIHLTNYESQRKFRVRPFQCNVCGKRTITENAMIVHQHRFHSLESDSETARCHICQKLVLKNNIQQHMLVHTQIRVRCNLCNRSYKQKQSLRMHIKKFHPNVMLTQSAPLPPSEPLPSGSLQTAPLSMVSYPRADAALDAHCSTNSQQYCGGVTQQQNHDLMFAWSNGGYSTCSSSSMYSSPNMKDQNQTTTPPFDYQAAEASDFSSSNSCDQIISYGKIIPNDSMGSADKFASGKNNHRNALCHSEIESNENIPANKTDRDNVISYGQILLPKIMETSEECSQTKSSNNI